MLLDVEFYGKGIAIFRTTGGELHAADLGRLNDLCDVMERQGRTGIILELSRLQRVSTGGLAALVELTSLRRRQEIGICGAPEKLSQLIENLGLYRGLTLFKDLASALRARSFKACQLRGIRSLVWSEPRSRGALDRLGAVELLDVLGKPLVHRVLDQLAEYGCRVAYLNPGQDAGRVGSYFSGEPVIGQCQFFLGAEMGPASHELGVLLRRLSQSQAVVDDDLLIVPSDQLDASDLGAFLEHHRNDQAELTVMMGQETALGSLGPHELEPWEPSALLIRPDLIPELPSQGCRTPSDLVSFAYQKRRKVAVYRTEFQPLKVQSPRSYHQMLSRLLEDPREYGIAGEGLPPSGIKRGDGCFVSVDAQVDGLVYIGAGAEVSRHVRIIGPAIIGDGVKIPPKSLIRNSILLSGAQLRNGSLVDGKLVGRDLDVSLTVPSKLMGSSVFSGDLPSEEFAPQQEKSA